MKVTITANRAAKHLTITLTDLDWEALQQRNFYQGEQPIQHVVTAVGQALTRQSDTPRKAGGLMSRAASKAVTRVCHS